MNFLKNTWSVILLMIFHQGILLSQTDKLQSGPMLGPVSLRSATIWVQTKEAATVQVKYQVLNSPNTQKKASDQVSTLKDNAYTTTIALSHLEPGTTYMYEVYINDRQISVAYPLQFTTQTHWQYRNDPPDFSFIAGSCVYVNDTAFDRPGKPYGGEYQIFEHMTNANPTFMVWLGDNTYLREGDYESRAGIYYRQTHTRSLPELQPFLAKAPHFAIWDDHDYGPNDSDWTYPLKHHALDAFKDFWPSESYGSGHTEGITNSFAYNDCQFFMLDDRWYRTVDTVNGTILGEQQKYWLKESLLGSKAPFKFVCVGGQFLSDFAGFENFANYADERAEIIQYIDDHNIKGVVFLTGDRHHSEISKIITEKGNVIYDVTSSAITSSTYDHSSEPNHFRVDGSMISVRNFALFNVAGTRKNRKLNVVFKNTEGIQLYAFDFEF